MIIETKTFKLIWNIEYNKECFKPLQMTHSFGMIFQNYTKNYWKEILINIE